MHFILLAVLSALLILSAPAGAGEHIVSLQEAYDLALKNHESVKVAGEVLYQLEKTRRKAVSNILPTITADGSYTKFSDEKVSSITVIQPDNSLNYSLRLSLPLYRGGREWSALRQARHMIEAGDKGAELTKEDVISAVSYAYMGRLKLQKEIEIKEADLKRAEEWSRVASAKFRVGEVTRAAVLRADAETAGIQADLSRVKKELHIAEDRLARLIGVQSGFDIEEPPQKDVPDGKVEELILTALNNRNDYLKTNAEVELAKEGIRYARGGFMPTLRLDGVYSGRDQDPVSSAFFNKESIYASITLTYPLYEGGLRAAEVREAESKFREAGLNKIILAKEIDLEIRDASYSIDASRISRSISFARMIL